MANHLLPQFLRRVGELRWLWHGVLPGLATLLILFSIDLTIFPVAAFPDNWPPDILAAGLIVGILVVWERKRWTPEKLTRVGHIVAPSDGSGVAAATSTGH
jgi:hypothetical protein